MSSFFDEFTSSVHLVYSTQPGMGKSLYVQRMAERLKEVHPVDYVCIPIHGPVVSVDQITEQLLSTMMQGTNNSHLQVLHFDISHSVSSYTLHAK